MKRLGITVFIICLLHSCNIYSFSLYDKVTHEIVSDKSVLNKVNKIAVVLEVDGFKEKSKVGREYLLKMSDKEKYKIVNAIAVKWAIEKCIKGLGYEYYFIKSKGKDDVFDKANNNKCQLILFIKVKAKKANATMGYQGNKVWYCKEVPHLNVEMKVEDVSRLKSIYKVNYSGRAKTYPVQNGESTSIEGSILYVYRIFNRLFYGFPEGENENDRFRF